MHNPLSSVLQLLHAPERFYREVANGRSLSAKASGLALSLLLCFGTYGFVTGLGHSLPQALSSSLKLPLLFLLTMAFTLPALSFFALALLGIRFSFQQAGVAVLSGLAVTAFLLLGLAPITLFFVLTSTNYPFFQLLTVVFVGISGLIGLGYFLWGFTRIIYRRREGLGHLERWLLGVWVLLYGFVGAQMTWRLSPLVGDPALPFRLFRPSRDNFFVDVVQASNQIFGARVLTNFLMGGVSIFSWVFILGLFLFFLFRIVNSGKKPPASVEHDRSLPSDSAPAG